MPPSKMRYRIDRSRIAKAKPHLSRSSSRLPRDDGGPKLATGFPPNLPNSVLGKAADMGMEGQEPESEDEGDLPGEEDDSSSDEEDGRSSSSSSDDDSMSEDEGVDGSSHDEDNPFAEGLPPGDHTNDASSTNTGDNPFLPKSTMASDMQATTTTAGSVATGPVTAPAKSATSSSSPNIAAATGTSAASTSNNQPTVNTSAHHSANHTAVIVVGSMIGVVAVATVVYLLCRYCKPVRDKVAAIRARRSQRLGDNENPPSPGMSQVSTDATGRPRQEALASTPNLLSEKLENPFSDQVPLANSDVSSNGPTLRQVSIPSNPRPLTWTSSDTDTTYPADTILKEYGPATSAPLTPLPAVPALHPTGLANNPPTPVSGRRVAPRRPPFLQQRPVVPQPLVPGAVAGLNIRESVSSPTPSDFPVPRPAESVVSLARPYSQYQPRIRKSITPSESASNGPFSPLPLPAMPAAFNSRWSRNSSSVNNGRSTQLSKGTTAIRRVSDGDPPGTPLPPPLPLAVKRSSAGSVASSIRSSGSGASVKDMTR